MPWSGEQGRLLEISGVEYAVSFLIGIPVALAGLVLVGWLGLKVKARPFAPHPGEAPDLETIPLPDGLPAPVERFYRAIYGEGIPLIESAIISGRAQLRVFGITFPARFRFTHIAGQSYRHRIEATIFGLPIMKVNERYLDGTTRLELPFGVVEDEPKVDQAANLGLWTESAWLPSVWITAPRVRWEPVDDDTALLRVPFGEIEDTIVVRFDPQTGMLRVLEAMRYKDAADEAKTLWINTALEWRDLDGATIPTVAAIVWFDEGTPWAVFTVEEVVYS